ncbi:MAG: pantoate--beta-alanine ligase [Bacteroidales bacterium]|nr:pantoate--beta-alanine ligase [Bacteroidales bacterium]
MQVFESPAEFQAYALSLRANGRRIGLVPTMGNLHEGHLSLVRIAREHADDVLVSDFVNPIQFGPNEDFAAYPRTFEDDCAKCEAEGVAAIFHPSPAAMYLPDASVSLVEKSLSRFLCGASRPGHFNGVCTVVCKLFQLAVPHVAVFGQKDAQQLAIIRRMVRDLSIPVEIFAGPISREPDGLARSSRNQYLTPEQRAQAPALHAALVHAALLYSQGEKSAPALVASVRSELATLAPLANPEYVTVSDADSLEPLDGPIAAPALLALAVRFGTTRLIDNVELP